MKIYYNHKPDIWSASKCARLAKANPKNALGTSDGIGYVGHLFGHYAHGSGTIDYNGGCIRNGQWYDGEHFPLPIIASGYELVRIAGSPNHWILKTTKSK